MAINELIARGITQASPVTSYYQAKQDQQRAQMNRLAMQESQQTMGINQEKMQMLKTQKFMESVSPALKKLASLPPEKKADFYNRAVAPYATEQAQKYGLPSSEIPTEWNAETEQKIEPILAQFEPDETFSEVFDKSGQIVGQRSSKDNKVHSDPRAPSKVLQSDDPDVFAGEGSKSNKFKLNEERRVAENATYKAIKGNEELINLVSDDDFVGGNTGDAIGMINSVAQGVQNYLGYGSVIDREGNIDETLIDPKSKQFSKLRKKAIQGDRYSAALIEMAYAKAKIVDPASKITDKDFNFARRMLASGSDKAGIIATLRDSNKRAIANYNAEENITAQRNKWYEPSIYTQDRYNELYGEKSGDVDVKSMSDADILDALNK